MMKITSIHFNSHFYSQITSTKVPWIELYRREIGLGLFIPANPFLSSFILDLFYTDRYWYKIASVYI